MYIQFICTSLFFLFVMPAAAANTITFYRDGALHQQEAVAAKGIIEVPLAAGLLEHSLSITPAPGTTIIGVESVKSGSSSGGDSELETLTEQRRRLEDRLQALETREAIFTAAAKSQSGKAPRKTKANPDPMLTIRQGTDFAIAQLESVYTARRKTTHEIQKIDARLAAKKGRRPAENTLRITVSPPRGAVTLRYATAEQGWQPQYNLYLTGAATAKLQLSARIEGSLRGYQMRVSPVSLAESSGAETFTLQSGSSAPVATYHMPITEERSVVGIFNSFAGTITNNSPHYLPGGDSGLFRNGVYLGKFRFEGISSGRSRSISVGE